MADVQFNEAPVYQRLERPKRGITGWLIARKLAKDEQGASALLLLVAGAAIVCTVLLWMSGFVSGGSAGVSEQERTRLETMP